MRPRPSAPRRTPLSAAIVALTAIFVLALPATPAFAAPATTVGIAQTGADTQASGNEFSYQVAFQCSNVDDPPDPCEDVAIRIPLESAASFDVDVPGLSNPDQWYVDEATGELVILMGTVDAGQSLTVPFTVTPPNHTTLDETTWTLTPTAVSSNATASDAPLPAPYQPSATSTATAAMGHTITKTLDGSVFREPGDLVTWTLVVSCTQAASGNLLAQSMTVTDTLPTGLIFDSAVPAPSGVDGQTVSWALPGDGDMPSSCTEPGANGTFEIEITALVDPDFTPADGAERLTNLADVTAIPIGQDEGVTHSTSSSITVTDDPSAFPGTFGKDSFAQLNDDESQGGDGARTTFPGPWNGYYDAQPGNVMQHNAPNAATDYQQSGYQLRYQNQPQALGFQVELDEPMPCIADDDATDAVHHSLAPGSVCAQDDLAFHVTTVAIWANSPAHYGLPPISDDYAPTGVRASDGSTFTLELTEHGGNWANYAVPAAEIGNVASLFFPRDPGMASDDMRWGIFGYADADTIAGDVVRNTGTLTTYYGDADTVASRTSESANIFIIADPLVGIVKRMTPSTVEPGGLVPTEIVSSLDTQGTVTADLVMTDLLPTGFSIVDPASTIDSTVTINYTPEGSPSGEIVEVTIPLTLEVIDNFQGTGRQLLRMTLPQEQLESYGAVQLVTHTNFTLQAPTSPGVFTNTAEVFYDNVDLSTTCNQIPQHEQLADDPLDLDGNPATGRHCQGQDDIAIVAPSGTADFAITKTVQGDADSAPRVPPAIGLVTEEGGSVEFGLTWTNTGATPLDSVVMYDIFPRVGDTGVSGTQAETPRGSEFDAVFLGLGGEIPAGVTIEYSTAFDSCRPEVWSTQGACTDDWSTSPPSDLSLVTGIRISSSATYATGEGFTVNVEMTTPPIELGQVAWNSVAGVATDTTTGVPLLPAEPPKVGITAFDPNLPPVLEKIADVQTASPGDIVTYTIRVSNPASWVQESVTLTDVLGDGLTFVSATSDPTVDGQHLTWEPFDLAPWEVREFTVQARIDPGVTGSVSNAAVIPGAIIPDPCEDDPDAACADVDVLSATLTIIKQVTGDAAGFAPDQFTAAVDCTLDGASLPGFPQSVTIIPGDEGATVSVPQGSHCTVTETDTGGATEVTVDPVDGIDIDQGPDAEYTVSIDNVYDAAFVRITKHFDGPGRDAFFDLEFTVHLQCTFLGDTVWDDTFTTVLFEPADSVESEVFGPFPVGTTCIVTETDSGGADSLAPPVVVDLLPNPDNDDITEVGLHNLYGAGTLTIVKQVDGVAASDPRATTAYDIVVLCQLETATGRETVLSQTVAVVPGTPVTLAGPDGEPLLIPVGAHCFAQEPDPQGAASVTIEHDSYADGVVVEPGIEDAVQQLEITVVNTFADDALPSTGGTTAGWLWLFGAGALLLGFVLVRRHRRA